jgi:hypothetical protein
MAAKKPDADREQRALHALFVAIAARDVTTLTRLLSQSPDLARLAAKVGATRQDPKTYYFASIGHYAYAGDTALHLAAASNVPSIAQKLIAAGADVRAKNRRGAEPLHYAADGRPESACWDPRGQAAVIGLLAEAGADVNALDGSGVAPLHRAVRTRSAAAVKALLANGAAPRLPNASGSTPLHLAVQNTGRGGSGRAASRSQQLEIIELLLAHGARSSDKNGAGKSVRDCASRECLELLGERHA